MKGIRILIVDDEPGIRDLLARILSAQGAICGTASTVAAGLREAMGSEWDLILLDIGLPDGNGIDLCRRLKENPEVRDVPVVMITGLDDSEQKVRAFSSGAVDYINKPFSVADLLARIGAVLRQRQAAVIAVAASRQNQKRTEQELVRISRALDSAGDAVLILDSTGSAVYANPSFLSLTSMSLELPAPKSKLLGLFAGENRFAEILESCSLGKAWSGELQLSGQTDQISAVLCRANPIPGEQGGFLGFVLALTDISQRKRLESDLRYLAEFDPLTGLWNRRQFEKNLESAIESCKETDAGYLLFLDLDNFKAVNEVAGHQAGDRLLVEVAVMLGGMVGKAGMVSHFGGDEFTILLTGASQAMAVGFAERILRGVEQLEFTHRNVTFPMSASIGLVAVTSQSKAEDLLGQGDSACHYVKARGRNGWHLFTEASTEVKDLARETHWAGRVRQALRERSFELWLQPIVGIESRACHHFEALARLRNSDGTLVMPAGFMPAAERFGLMEALDKHVLELAVQTLVKHPGFKIAVNLSAKSLNDPTLPDFVRDQITSAGIAPERLSFELTETVVVQDVNRASELMMRICALGCEFALDDFGSGASSMNYLRRLPVTWLKIDGSFVRELDKDTVSQALVKSMTEVGHALGKKIVAEFVVNEEVLAIAAGLGVDYAQGWAVSAAAPPDTFEVSTP